MPGRALKEPKLVRLVRRLGRVLERDRFPHRRSRFANHVFDDRQHLILVALRSHLGVSYRRFVEFLQVATRLSDALHLERVPHFSTLQKFEARQEVQRLERVLLGFVREFRIRVLWLAVDATGYQTSRASAYYSLRILTFEGAKRRRARRPWKATFVVDTRRRIFVAVRCNWQRGSDAHVFRPVLEKVRKTGVKIGLVTADKAYDSEANQVYVRKRLLAQPQIPVRRQRAGYSLWGIYRKQQAQEFDPALYRQRVQVESMISATKRTQGEAVGGRRALARRRELVIRAIGFNAYRAATVLDGAAYPGFLLSRTARQLPGQVGHDVATISNRRRPNSDNPGDARENGAASAASERACCRSQLVRSRFKTSFGRLAFCFQSPRIACRSLCGIGREGFAFGQPTAVAF